MQSKKSANLGKTGMNRNTAPHLLQEGEYVFMLNGNNESVIGDRLNNMNEPSNLLCLNFPVGYKVIGYKNDINSDKTYYFLTNPETGYSKFGYISNVQNIQDVSDLETECGDCNFKAILADPLENQTQIASCTFIELLDDSCNKGFNFDINFPIKKIEIKTEKCGKTIYFTDNLNPPRYIRLDDIERYTTETITEDCQEDNTAEIEPTKITKVTCPAGYVLDSATNTCVKTETSTIDACPEGYTYDPVQGLCTRSTTTDADIVIVMDTSGSVDANEMIEMQSFANSLVDGFTSQLSSGDVRMGVVKFDSNGNIVQNLTSNKTSISNAIDAPRPAAGGTNVASGLCEGSHVLNTGSGGRKSLILILDGTGGGTTTCGVSNEYSLATTLKNSGVDITMVVLGTQAERTSVLDAYNGGMSVTIPSPGTGINGNATYEAEFSNVSTIVDEVIESLVQEETTPTQCGSCTNDNNGTCTCSTTETVPATVDIQYFCSVGTLNEATNKCEYEYTTSNSCGCEIEQNTCLDADKLRIFPLHSTLDIEVDQLILGGRLRLGTYEFLGAYCDNLGNELSEYASITNPISIFDSNNNIMEQSELADRTSYAIKLNIKNLDDNFQFYKIAVIQTADLQRNTRYFEEGIHPINDTEVLYTTEEGKKEITIEDLFTVKPNILKAEGLSQANNILFLNGLTAEKEWNLQPVVNLMGSFLRWQTAITTEDYYQDGTASAKGKGYYRDEVQPFGIRFGSKTGYTTAIFPFIGRPASDAELVEMPENNDFLSLNSTTNECVGLGRTKYWQFYNTAEELGSCVDSSIPTTTIEEEVSKICNIENITTAPAGVITIVNIEEFTTLENFVNDLAEGGTCTSYDFCPYINPATNPDLNQDCTPDFENCVPPQNPEREWLQVNTITGGAIKENYAIFPDNYSKARPNTDCVIFIEDGGDSARDEEFDEQYLEDGTDTYALFRDIIFQNYAPFQADSLKITDSGSGIAGYIINYLGSTSLSSLRFENFEVSCTKTEDVASENKTWLNTTFTDRVHRNSMWFEIELDDIPEDSEGNKILIYEITPGQQPKRGRKRDTVTTESLRLSLFESSVGGQDKYCKFYNIKDGVRLYMTYNTDTEDLTIQDDEGNPAVTINTTSNKLYIAIDAAITAPELVNGENVYVGLATSRCVAVQIKSPKILSLEVSYDSISFDKLQKWTTNCQFDIPVINNCELQPYKFGKFGYVESTETYPDNNELYNSKNLTINVNDIPSNYIDEFIGYYGSGISNDIILLNDQTDFRCKTIRHYKFPDNNVAPFMWENKQAPFVENIIFPLGITIDEQVIHGFLDVAVRNGLITQEQRDNIDYYEIYKGDRRLDKTIIAKGLAYDMYEYEENSKVIKYSNYPYNDLGEDVLHYLPGDTGRSSFIEHPYGSDSNNSWTFHSPETDYLRPDLPTEVKVEGYMFGNSRGHFTDVEQHPKWVILGSDARDLASTLATAEVLAEAALAVAESAEVYRIQVGLANSVNPVGIGLNIAVLATQVFSSLKYKYGRYKYQWLETFKNLGSPENFAYYYSSEGYYNYFQTLQEQGNELRGLNVAKYLKDGRFYFTNEIEGSKSEVNNINRERSVYLEISKNYNISYPNDYKNYDNSDADRSSSSRTFLSAVGDCSGGRSKELVKNIASPYVSLKTYNPSQFGTVDSIKWLTTSFKGYLNDTSSPVCNLIFGGDVFISRHTLKRKFSMFLTDAMGVPSLTPFPYKMYSNIGDEPRFYCNYESTDNFRLDRGFPELDSEYNFDCLEGNRDFHLTDPTKFYLYYYGIPNFLCETEINTNYRYGKTEPQNNFYPNVGDFVDWTQEKNVSIREPNTYFYNFNYSKSVSSNIHRILPASYSREAYDCRYDSPNGVMYSQQDNSENDLVDPWLVFKPLDRYEFSTSYGKLIDLVGVENEQILVRFEDQKALFNAFDTLVDDGQNPQKEALGSGGIFARRPVTFSKADLGILGTQHTDYALTPYGLFDVDAKRGKIYRYSANSMEEISSFIGDKPSGMRNWFREHLPFKILKTYPDIDIDNKFKSIGISIGWDARFDRVFFTKNDYIPLNRDLCYNEGTFHRTEGQDIDTTIATYQGQGFTYEGIENCQMKFTREVVNITDATDIYAFFDTSSMQPQDGVDASTALNTWFTNYKASNPDFTGNLYILPFGAETYVLYPRNVQVGFNITNSGGWGLIAKLPPDWNTPEFVPPTDLLLLAFVDETNSSYHEAQSKGFNTNNIDSAGYILTKDVVGGADLVRIEWFDSLNPITTEVFEITNITTADSELNNYISFYDLNYGNNPTSGSNFRYDSIEGYLLGKDTLELENLLIITATDGVNTQTISRNLYPYIDVKYIQPTNTYINNFDVFKNIALPDYNFFRGVLYPIVQNLTGLGGGLVLQAMAAMKGRKWTQPEIDATGTQVDVSLLLTENPYENYEYAPGEFLQPLENYGWTGFYNKTSPASEVFSSQQFQDDLNQYVNPGGEEVEIETVLVDLPEVSLKDPTYFKDISWTIAYKPIDGQWVSYYSFKPDYYVNHNEYFQTGINYSEDSSEIGLWSHLLTNKSYQVFYGKKYPFVLEVPIKNENVNKMFTGFEISTEAKRFDENFGFSVNRYLTFNRAVFYNNTNNSGVLNLIPQKHSLAANSKYPITNANNTQDILVTSQDEDWNINYFYNRMKNDVSGIPMWIKDDNDINKTINNKAVSFYGKRTLERFRGEWAILKLEYDQDSRYNLMYKMTVSDEQVY